MASAAAWLADRVVSCVPVRHGVLTLPFALRYRPAFGPGLTSWVLAEIVRAAFGSMRRRARREPGIARSRCGAVKRVMRGGDALDSSVHSHTIAIDGRTFGGRSPAGPAPSSLCVPTCAPQPIARWPQPPLGEPGASAPLARVWVVP